MIQSDFKNLDRKNQLKVNLNTISNEIWLQVDRIALAYIKLPFCFFIYFSANPHFFRVAVIKFSQKLILKYSVATNLHFSSVD